MAGLGALGAGAYHAKGGRPRCRTAPEKPQPPHGEVILEAQNVTRKFGGLVANNNMSLQVAAGEIPRPDWS